MSPYQEVQQEAKPPGGAESFPVCHLYGTILCRDFVFQASPCVWHTEVK